MLKSQIKYRDGTKWKPLDIKSLVGKTLIGFLKETDKECIAAVLENEQPVLFISNREEHVTKYKEKGVSLHVEDILALMGTELMPQIAIQVFPDAKFVAIETPKDERKWW